MHLIDELRREHDLIERVLGSLRTYVTGRVACLRPEDPQPPSLGPCANADGHEPLTDWATVTASRTADAARFLRFFRLYAGHYHHAREEDTLFVALQRKADLPVERGPIAVMLRDHRRFAILLDELERLLSIENMHDSDAERLQACAAQYAHGLWHHIDAENNVLLPEGEARLEKAGVHELPSRSPTSEEAAARDDGLDLLERYPPTSDIDAFRGDGCTACPAYGRDCEGLEREWWNESEWEEFGDHLPSG